MQPLVQWVLEIISLKEKCSGAQLNLSSPIYLHGMCSDNSTLAFRVFIQNVGGAGTGTGTNLPGYTQHISLKTVTLKRVELSGFMGMLFHLC
jgi:hypothetical protein